MSKPSIWEIIFDKDETYIESENMFEIIYTMEVLINE